MHSIWLILLSFILNNGRVDKLLPFAYSIYSLRLCVRLEMEMGLGTTGAHMPNTLVHGVPRLVHHKHPFAPQK